MQTKQDAIDLSNKTKKELWDIIYDQNARKQLRYKAVSHPVLPSEMLLMIASGRGLDDRVRAAALNNRNLTAEEVAGALHEIINNPEERTTCKRCLAQNVRRFPAELLAKVDMCEAEDREIREFMFGTFEDEFKARLKEMILVEEP